MVYQAQAISKQNKRDLADIEFIDLDCAGERSGV
jgi:hypothetical protein